jgi:hypothetical protein
MDGKSSATDAYVGVASVFARAKFKEIARRKDNRPLMRLTLSRKQQKSPPRP